MWSFSYTQEKKQANSVSNENLLYSTPAYCKKNKPLEKQNNRNKIIKSDNTENTHRQSESTTLTQSNKLHIERALARGSHQYTHPSDAS